MNRLPRDLEAERSRLNLEAVFRSMPDTVVTLDRDMRVLHASRPLGSLCPRDWMAGQARPLQDLPEFASSRCLEVVRQVLATRQPVQEFRLRCCSGVRPGQVLVLNCTPLQDLDGCFSGAVLVFRDVTRVHELEQRLAERFSFRRIIGRSRKMQEVYGLLEQLSSLDTTVMVTGESGTGKELVVDALHQGGRSAGPLIKVNCAALSQSVLESELFGHARGSFTGADRDMVGRFEAAHGGTLFLDEIGEVPPAVQLRLLRVLENKEFERVGETRTRRTDARIVAATNADLEALVASGRFRADLYYRLRVMTIMLPPLRERAEDIPLLVDNFIASFSRLFGKSITTLSQEAVSIFMTHPWPGNVRELQHAIEYACILCPGGVIETCHLPRELLRDGGQGQAQSRRRLPAEDDRAAVMEALRAAGGNKAKAARLLNVSRLTMYNKIRKYGLAVTGAEV